MNEPLSIHEERDRALFDRIASSYCRKDMLPAHRLARKLRLEQTLALVDYPQNADVLELGCGAGFAAAYLSGRFRSYHGVDYSSELIKYAKHHHSINGISFQCANIDDWQSEARFDVIFMIGFLHHLQDPAATLAKITSHLKPGGWIVANEPQKGNALVTAARNFRKKVDDHYSDEQVEISPTELRSFFSQAGLTEIRLKSQGIFSTPLAELKLPLQSVVTPLSRIACGIDRFIEKHATQGPSLLAWNIIAAGKMR